MVTKLPYVGRPTAMVKILEKIKEAKTPDKFTIDFLETKLGCKGGSSRAFIPLAKKLGLLGTDGSPTDLYKKFRNPTLSKAALATAVKKGYKEIFDRKEYAGNASKEDFKGLVVEITGKPKNDQVVNLICQTFDHLKKLADFDAKIPETSSEEEKPEETLPPAVLDANKLNLGLSYTINLVLPKTEDSAVFNAIFKSLRENLLSK